MHETPTNPLTGKPFQWDEYYAFNDTVIACGIDQVFEGRLRQLTAALKMKLLFTDQITNLIAIPSSYLIIEPRGINADELRELVPFWEQDSGQRILFISPPALKNIERLNSKTEPRALEDLEILRLDILNHKKSVDKNKKRKDKYGNQVMRILGILKYMKSHRLSTSQALAEDMGVSIRTIQRDLNLIDQLGEPLGYDPKTKSYFLLTGKSLLWED